MGAAPALSEQFAFKNCFDESPLRECRSRKRDNFVVIEVDTDDFGDVVVLDVPESFRKKFRKKPKHVISLDDDDDDDGGGGGGDSRDCPTNSDVGTSNRCSPTQGAHPSSSASADEGVSEGNTPVKLSKSKRTYSGKNISRNRSGPSLDSEGCSSESDCSDCELMEGSLEKLREQWEKASFKRRRDTRCVPPDFKDKAGTSAPSSHPIYDNVEEATSDDAEPIGEQRSVKESLHHYDPDNAFAGSPQSFSQDSSERDNDPMEMDEQCSRTYDNFVSSVPLHHSAEQCVDKISKPGGDISGSSKRFSEQFKFPCQRCDANSPTEVSGRNSSADVTKEPLQAVKTNHAGLFDRNEGAGVPSSPLDLKSSSIYVNERECSSGENNIITDRQKMKETEEYKRAMEEELAARQQQLLLQADEAQRLRNRKKAERTRLLMNERRQKQRVEEIRQARQKDEEKLNLKEKHRVEVKKELRMVEALCTDMASLLRRLGIHVGGGMFPSPNEVCNTPHVTSAGTCSHKTGTPIDVELKCGHNLPAKLCVSKKEGKRFYGCSLWPKTCGFLVWEDELLEEDEVCKKCNELLQAKLMEQEKRIADLNVEVRFLVNQKLKLEEKKGSMEKSMNVMNDELCQMRDEKMKAEKKEKYGSIAGAVIWILFLIIYFRV